MPLLYTTFSSVLNIHFQPWALPSLFAVLINTGLVIFIWKKSSRDIASKIYILSLLGVIIWGIGEFFERSSVTHEAAVFWGDVGVVGPVFVGVLFFTFTLILIERGILFENIFALLLLYTPSVAFLFLIWNTDLIIRNTLEPVFWGWFPHVGPFYLAFVLWVVGFFVLSFLLLLRFYFQTQQHQQKKQISLILFGISIPLIGGAVTDGIFPFLGIGLPGVAVVFTTIFAVTISYAIVKYKLFIISPALALSTVMDSMSESLIVLSRSYRVEFVNRPALEMLGYREEEILGEGLKKIIAPGKVWQECKKYFLNMSGRGKREVIHHESELLSKEKKKIPVRFSVSSLKGPGGEVIGIVMLAFDITQQKKLVSDLRSATRELQIVRYNLEKQLSRVEEV